MPCSVHASELLDRKAERGAAHAAFPASLDAAAGEPELQPVGVGGLGTAQEPSPGEMKTFQCSGAIKNSQQSQNSLLYSRYLQPSMIMFFYPVSFPTSRNQHSWLCVNDFWWCLELRSAAPVSPRLETARSALRWKNSTLKSWQPRCFGDPQCATAVLPLLGKLTPRHTVTEAMRTKVFSWREIWNIGCQSPLMHVEIRICACLRDDQLLNILFAFREGGTIKRQRIVLFV